ncbi:nucleotidyltransferase domain-containing protein [Ectothiorhodospira shaposhnikovii]|uniref:nucleotidyltransferase domain-containing protein n=1 Tax=Ectothiorhodospira shaposhnikovii TaxID=1054 RepID=UPI001EE882C0|nr:nucleotidyltransferase domain-containing protein [Ectothiorhodospira shaposhnikovii]MCG5513275.1 nucleotidyltransferase domain-containing protein [Ectothiorhodospira shaposhnikovii]
MASADREIAVLWLYGSRAKNTATETSDYDLAVAFRTPDGGNRVRERHAGASGHSD